MSDLALKLIRENKEKYARNENADFLDLANCGFQDTIPDEVMKATVLKIIVGLLKYQQTRAWATI